VIVHPLTYFRRSVHLELILCSEIHWQDSHRLCSPDGHVGQSNHARRTGNADLEWGLHGGLVETREGFPGMGRLELRRGHPSARSQHQRQRPLSLFAAPVNEQTKSCVDYDLLCLGISKNVRLAERKVYWSLNMCSVSTFSTHEHMSTHKS
jgi:hypothetical protein